MHAQSRFKWVQILSIYHEQFHDEQNQQALEETGYWGRWAAGCLFLAKSTGRLMLSLRSIDVLEPSTYGTWGGAGDGDETPEQAVKREAKEECEYEGKFQLIPLYVFKHASGFQYHNYLFVVNEEFTPRLNWENSGYIWAYIDELPSPLHPGAALLIENARDMILKQINLSCTPPSR